MLGNVFVVEIGDTQIEKNIEQKGKVVQGKVHAIGTGLQGVLHDPVDTKYPNRFDDEV